MLQPCEACSYTPTFHSKLSLNLQCNGCYITHATSSVIYGGSSNSRILKQPDPQTVGFLSQVLCNCRHYNRGTNLENSTQQYKSSLPTLPDILIIEDSYCCLLFFEFLFPHYNVYMQLLVGPSMHSTHFSENITTDPHCTHSPEKTTACYAHLNPSVLEQFPSVTDTSRLTCVEFGLGIAVEF